MKPCVEEVASDARGPGLAVFIRVVEVDLRAAEREVTALDQQCVPRILLPRD